MNAIAFTKPQSSNAARLVSELSNYLRKLPGNQNGKHYQVELFNADLDAFVVLRRDDKPLTCGAIHFVDPRTCEIKPMFSKQQGIGIDILPVLENKAKLLGYTNAVITTRKANTQLVEIYLNKGFKIITPFGKYKSKPKSICLGKSLYPT